MIPYTFIQSQKLNTVCEILSFVISRINRKYGRPIVNKIAIRSVSDPQRTAIYEFIIRHSAVTAAKYTYARFVGTR